MQSKLWCRNLKRPFVRPRYRWDDNIKWILKKWDGTVYTGFIWLGIGMLWAVVSTVMTVWVPSNAGNF
jgi:hypothetical protein